MSDDNINKIPINELRQEDGASDLASSPDMEPYLNWWPAPHKTRIPFTLNS